MQRVTKIQIAYLIAGVAAVLAIAAAYSHFS